MQQSPDFFSLLEILPAFGVDKKTLEEAYFKQQRLYHPDRFAGKPAPERQAATARSVDINQAYQTLKDPLKRAQYLLKLQGITVGTDHDSVKPSHELLTEVMEWRETGIEVPALKEQQQQSIAKIAEHYRTGAWEAMAQETLRLGYIVKTMQG